ncbi:MAG: hypothetical protein SH847_13810 [Roseiflexaceae bacterium]|nr:hypothetical protein [Roseiflexaceae bacterium]
MRRTLFSLAVLVFALSACGVTGDTTVTLPPNATKVSESVNIKEIDTLITQWKKVAPEQMKADAVKPETLEETVYTAPSTLADIQTYYNNLVTTKGWFTVKKMTNLQNDQVVLLGYEHGTTALVVGAIDATRFGGTGVVVYTLKGTK